MKLIIIIFLFCIFLFQACQNQQKGNADPEGIQIKVSWEEIDSAQVIPFDLLFDSLEVINTPPVSKIPLSRIIRIIEAGDYLVAITREALVSMHRHDSTYYIYHKVGRGPEEYLILQDVIFDEARQKLLLLTGYPNRILTLDLQCNFISSYPFSYDIMWERMFLHRGELYMFGELASVNVEISKDVISKFSGNQLSEPIAITNRAQEGSPDWYWQLSEDKNNLIIGLNARDSLFLISDTMGISAVKIEYAHEKSTGLNFSHTVKLLYRNEHLFIFNRAAHKEGYLLMKYFLYDPDSEISSVFLNIQIMGIFINSDQENMYFAVLPSHQLPFLESWEKNLTVTEKRVYKQVLDLLHTCSEDDNPIILRMHVKQKGNFHKNNL